MSYVMTGILFPVWLIYSEPEGFACETFESKTCLLVYPEKKAVYEVLNMFISTENRLYRPFEVTDRFHFVAILTAMQTLKGMTHVTLNDFGGISSRIVPLTELL